MPNELPWNDAEFRTRYEIISIHDLMEGALPAAEMHQDTFQRLLDGHNFDEQNQQIISIKSGYLNQCNQQANIRNDGKIREYYQDLAYIIDGKNGNFTQMMSTSPYMNDLIEQKKLIINPSKFSSDDQKAGLTVPLYNVLYDLNHAIKQEVEVEYARQRYEEAEWNSKSEAEYLSKLYDSHTNLLQQYNKLSQFSDDPQNNTLVHTRANLRTILGKEGNNSFAFTMGMIRGEKTAIENGWGRDQLSILGVIGGIEEQIKLSAQDPALQDSMPQFRADFMSLKNECFFSTVPTTAEKKEIAEKVRSFLTGQTSPAAQAILNSVEHVKKALDKSIAAVDVEIELELKKQRNREQEQASNDDLEDIEDKQDFEEINKDPFEADISIIAAEKEDVENNNDKVNIQEILKGDPNQDNVLDEVVYNLENVHLTFNGTVEHLVDKLRDAQMQDDYTSFVREYIDVVAKNADNIKVRKPLGEITNAILQSNFVGFNGVRRAAYNFYYDLVVACDAEEKQKAEDIRAGKEVLPRTYGTLIGDYKFSIDCAKKLLANSPLHKKLRAAEALCNQFEIAEPEQISVFAPLNSAMDRDASYKTSEKQIINNLSQEKKAITSFAVKLESLKRDTSKHYTTLQQLSRHKPTAVYNQEAKRYYDLENDRVVDPKSANSQTFMNMLNSASKICRLNNDSSPKDVIEAYRELRDTTQAYMDKIDSHTFAGILSNGRKRRRSADELHQLAVNALSKLGELAKDLPMDIGLKQQLENNKAVEANTKILYENMIKENLASEQKKCIDTFFNNNNEITKDTIKKGLSQLVVIVTLSKEFENPGDKLVAPSTVNHDYIVDQAQLIETQTATLNSVVDKLDTKEAMEKMIANIKNNPKSVIEELSKEQHEPNAAVENQNKNKVMENKAPVNEIGG